MRRLERMFQHNPVVLLAGNTGIGKTELALGLARWLRDTGVRPGGVFYTDFRIGAGLERVVHEVGTEVAGLDFADMNAQQQRRWLVQYLQEHPCLLVWDSLENVAGFPDPTSGLLDESEQTDLYSFLSEVADGGKSWGTPGKPTKQRGVVVQSPCSVRVGWIGSPGTDWNWVFWRWTVWASPIVSKATRRTSAWVRATSSYWTPWRAIRWRCNWRFL